MSTDRGTVPRATSYFWTIGALILCGFAFHAYLGPGPREINKINPGNSYLTLKTEPDQTYWIYLDQDTDPDSCEFALADGSPIEFHPAAPVGTDPRGREIGDLYNYIGWLKRGDGASVDIDCDGLFVVEREQPRETFFQSPWRYVVYLLAAAAVLASIGWLFRRLRRRGGR